MWVIGKEADLCHCGGRRCSSEDCNCHLQDEKDLANARFTDGTLPKIFGKCMDLSKWRRHDDGLRLAHARARLSAATSRSSDRAGAHGDMIVVQEKSSALNRYTNIARFQIAGPAIPQLIPPLHDAVLS